MKLVGRALRSALAITIAVILLASIHDNDNVVDTSMQADITVSTETAVANDRLQSVAGEQREAIDAVTDRVVAQQQLETVAPVSHDSATMMGPPEVDAETPATQPAAESEASAKGTTPRDKMSGPVAALLDAGAIGDAELVVRYDEHPELFDDELVAKLGGEVVRSYAHLEMRAIRLPVASLEELATDTNVDWLSLDEDVSSTSVASRAAANLPATGSINAGYTGSSVGIAVLDTGIAQHGDLSNNIMQYSFLGGAYPTPVVVGSDITVLNNSVREDLYGHGTHIAGLLAGSGSASSDLYEGAAQGSTLLSLQVLDQNGGGSMSDVMAALDWLLTYGEHFDIRVVNLSLGKGISESNQTDPLVLAVERLWDAGMVVVVAAGNDGFSGSMTINSPGNSRKVITVGSVTDNGTGADYSDDYVSSFSSQGPTIGDYVLKPDLLAPGNRLVGTVAKNSKLVEVLPTRQRGCQLIACGNDVYLEMSGTSMATPMVAAAVALMLEKDPTLSPATVKARLMRSAQKIDADPTEAGAGLLDTNAALNDSGVLAGDALSPLMIFDDINNTVLIEDTAVLWGDNLWGSAYLFNNGATWASGAAYTDANGVTASGYVWTDGGVGAKGYQWTDGGIGAKGYQWTDGMAAKSLLDSDSSNTYLLNDDEPGQ
ncbi:MAG: S8 family peptidase [Gammaproteobacteria bacterium]|nr:S8 family peptidase [Gammaproteobacteria bacterium]